MFRYIQLVQCGTVVAVNWTAVSITVNQVLSVECFKSSVVLSSVRGPLTICTKQYLWFESRNTQIAMNPSKLPAVQSHFHTRQFILSSACCTLYHCRCCSCFVVSAAFHHLTSSWVLWAGWGPRPPSQCLEAASAPACCTAHRWPLTDRETPVRPRGPCRSRWCCRPSPLCWADVRPPTSCAPPWCCSEPAEPAADIHQ